MKNNLYYIIGALLLVITWLGINYINYTDNQTSAKAEIQSNVDFINEVVFEIDIEQRSLEGVQKTLTKMSIPSEGGHINSPLHNELQKRIDALETEKVGYEEEKGIITKEIMDYVKLMKWNTGNPLINIVILPLLLYFGKKSLDVLFKLFEKKIFEEEEAT